MITNDACDFALGPFSPFPSLPFLLLEQKMRKFKEQSIKEQLVASGEYFIGDAYTFVSFLLVCLPSLSLPQELSA
jgi:hypothetical protein